MNGDPATPTVTTLGQLIAHSGRWLGGQHRGTAAAVLLCRSAIFATSFARASAPDFPRRLPKLLTTVGTWVDSDDVTYGRRRGGDDAAAHTMWPTTAGRGWWRCAGPLAAQAATAAARAPTALTSLSAPAATSRFATAAAAAVGTATVRDPATAALVQRGFDQLDGQPAPPCFRLDGSQIRLIQEPSDFYDTLLVGPPSRFRVSIRPT